MYRTLFATIAMLTLVAPITRAQTPRNGVRAVTDQASAGKCTLTVSESAGARVLFLFDRSIVKEFNRAWRRAAAGTAAVEAVVLIVRNADGSVKAIAPAATNEYHRLSFRWQPGTVAVLHTHPNHSDPRPQPADIAIAERFQVPMFTLTIQGMFLYDPATGLISKVQNGIDWLEYSRWARDAPVIVQTP